MDVSVVRAALRNIKDLADALYGGSAELSPHDVETMADEIRGYVSDINLELGKK